MIIQIFFKARGKQNQLEKLMDIIEFEFLMSMTYHIENSAVTQHTTACCSVQVIDVTRTEGPLRKYYIPQSSTTET